MLEWIALILVIIGAFNWGSIGFFGVNLVEKFFGKDTSVSRLIYSIVGVAGLYILLALLI